MDRDQDCKPLVMDDEDGPAVRSLHPTQPWESRAYRIAISVAVSLALILSATAFGLTITRELTMIRERVITSPARTMDMDEGSEFKFPSFKTSPPPPAKMNLVPGQVLDCGGNMETALAKGCRYDTMIPAWVPAPCFNESMYNEFIAKAEGNWRWYRDRAGTRETSLSLVETGRYLYLFTSHKYHFQHCIYTWRKQIAALEAGGAWIEDYFMDPEHGDHCTRVMTSRHAGTNASSNVLKQAWLTCKYYSMSAVE